jgi:two-component system cell cycle sensor histidine kinase/response regulator CckA
VRLLLVDDHPQYRETAARLLSVLGHEVIEAEDPEAAAAAVEREGDRIQVVLLDLFLGASDGVALADELQARHPGVRILFMSGHDEATWETAALHGGRRSFIEKPFSLPALEEALNALSGA